MCPPGEKPTKKTLFFRKKTAGDLSALPQTVSLPSPDEKYGSFFGRSQRSNPYGRIWGHSTPFSSTLFYCKLEREPIILDPKMAGIDFYGDTLFTTQSQIDNQYGRVCRFRAASMMGWDYAMNNAGEMADIILQKYSARHSKEHLLFEWKEMKKLLRPDIVEIGRMYAGRWNSIAGVYRDHGLISSEVDLKKFMFDPSPRLDYMRWILWISGLSVLLVLAVAVLLRLINLNHRLRQELSVREHLLGVLENIPESIYIMGKEDKKIIFCNQAFIKAIGFNPLGQSCSNTIQCNSSCELCRCRDMKDGETLCWEVCVERLGRHHYNIDRAIKWIDERDAIFRLAIDITKLKQTESALFAAKEEAEKASLAKSEFLANMSHEIRAPMNGVLGFAQVLRNTQLNQEQIEYLDIVCSSGESLLALIDDILDLSKIEARKIELESINFSIHAVVSSAISIVSPKASVKNLRIESFLGRDVPNVVSGDKNRLQQILLNLAGNAVKFTHEGGFTIKVTKVGDAGSKVELRFEVEDSGIGIPADKLQKIFEPFLQADSSTTRKYGGSGLGLTISKQLVELMGGQIGVQSTYGIGSLFWFTIKLGASDNNESSAKRDSVEIVERRIRTASVGKKILVVDDEPINLNLVYTMLAKLGFEVDIAVNGSEAIERLRQTGYSMVFMDCMMPGMNGLDVCKAIRNPTTAMAAQKTPIIAFTANAMHGSRDQCIKAGMDDWMAKPFVYSKFLEKIERWM